MTTNVETPGAPPQDERVKEMSRFRKMMIRPELGAIAGTILVFMFFLAIARDTGMFSPEGVMTWTTVSAQFVIIAVGACLLMIAGEFDLSVGSMIGFAGIVIAITSVSWGWPVWLSIITAFLLAMSIGALNGYLVIMTGLPSFIVTLAFLYILRGLTIFGAIATTRKTIIGGVREVAEGDWLAPFFGGKIFTGLFQWLADIGLLETFTRGTRVGQPIVDGIPMLIVWAVVLLVFGHILLTRTRFGNWIYASGGDAQAARYAGVPVDRVKITMFMFTAFCATVFATAQVMEFGSAAADRGVLKGIRGHHIGGHWRRPADRRLWFGDRRGARRPDLRGRATRPVFRWRREFPVPGFPGRHLAVGGDLEYLHPANDYGGEVK